MASPETRGVRIEGTVDGYDAYLEERKIGTAPTVMDALKLIDKERAAESRVKDEG